jgi:hypothetical protein
MQISTVGMSQSAHPAAVSQALDQLANRLGGEPDFVVAYHTADAERAMFEGLAARRRPGSFVGCSSCQGVLTEQGLFGFGQPGFALWGVRDPMGAYGSGFAEIARHADLGAQRQAAHAAAKVAYEQAVSAADRPGESPALVWVLVVPGVEEAVLAGLDEATGGGVPVAGGSAADNQIAGGWISFGGGGCGDHGVAVAVFFASTAVASSFQSGYEPAGPSAVVTRAVGRSILEFDGRPAAEVYNGWIGGRLDRALGGGGEAVVLGDTTMFPLGREIGSIRTGQRSIPYYSLLHPERVTAGHALSVFADVQAGERLYLMTGSIDSLVSRAGRVVGSALSQLASEHAGVATGSVATAAGGLVIYCAGCMLTVGDRLPQVVSSLGEAFAGAPFIGAFTFGEQGCLLGGENQHGNLMISVAAFES